MSRSFTWSSFPFPFIVAVAICFDILWLCVLSTRPYHLSRRDFINFVISFSSYRAAKALLSVIETSRLMLCRKTVASSSQSDTEPTNAFYEQNVKFPNVIRDGTKQHPVKPSGY